VLPSPWVQARTVPPAGGGGGRARRWGLARAAFVDALEQFDSLGAVRWAEIAAAQLARLPGRRPADDTALTAREREIAELVSAGLANKQVAARLYVSLRTVETTLSKVYAKLGVSSRTQLTAHPAQRLPADPREHGGGAVGASPGSTRSPASPSS